MIVRQPNGLLCRFNDETKEVEKYNMTEDDYRNILIIEAIRKANKQADEILTSFVKDYFDLIEKDIPENILYEMKNVIDL